MNRDFWFAIPERRHQTENANTDEETVVLQEFFISFGVILVAVVFFAAGVAKIRSIDTLEGVIQNFKVLPARLSRPFALVLPPIEIVVAAALALPATRIYGAATATVLLVIFTVAIALNLARGRREIDCGCFSSELKQNLSCWLVARNLLLIVCSAGLTITAAGWAHTSPSWVAWLLGALSVGFAIFIYLTATTLTSNTATVAQRRAIAAGNF